MVLIRRKVFIMAQSTTVHLLAVALVALLYMVNVGLALKEGECEGKIFAYGIIIKIKYFFIRIAIC